MGIKSKKKQFIFYIDFIMIAIGTAIMGIAFSVFMEPNAISTGGFSGLAMIINYLLAKAGISFLTSSIIYFILNIGLYLYALKTLGKRFAIKALVGITSYSLFMELFSVLPITLQYEPLISAIYGGALMGLGLGIVVRSGGSTGGSDMIACIIKYKKNKISIGTIVVSVDIIVVILTMLVFPNGIEILPYTIIALLLALVCTDFVNEGYKQVKAYYIITDKPDQISEQIMQKLGRGCTSSKVVGMHSKDEKYILTCLIAKYQVAQLRRVIYEIDDQAFVFSTTVNEVLGRWASQSDIINTTDTGEDNPK